MLPSIAERHGDLSSGTVGLVFLCFYFGCVVSDSSLVAALQLQFTSPCLRALGCTDDIRTSRRALVTGLTLTTTAGIVLYCLPPAVAGDTMRGYVVFLVFIWMLGLGQETLISATSTISATWYTPHTCALATLR
jgi:hypothetical protein